MEPRGAGKARKMAMLENAVRLMKAGREAGVPIFFDVGVAATVFGGRDLDFHLIIARDACATSHDQRAHDVLMDVVFPRMSRIRSTEQVIQMIKAG